MKLLVVGSGSIGKRHLNNFRTIGVKEIGAVDPRPDRRQEIEQRFPGVKAYESLEAALVDKYDAAVIASPTSLHIPQAIALAKRGVHLMIEKPLGHSLEGLEELSQEVKKGNLKVLIAYPFRFDGSFLKLQSLLDAGAIGKPLYVRGEFSEYLPDWHPWEDYRHFYMAKKSLGGGSLLDQSHVLNMVEALFGEILSVFAFNDRVSSLEVETDDLAELLVKFKGGVVGTVHMDMLGRRHVKRIEIKGEKGDLLWDFYTYEVRWYDADEKRWEMYPYKNDKNDMYIAESKHFLACVDGNETPRISLDEGILTMKVLVSAQTAHCGQKAVLVS
jgi:predicted dehydrogenase